VCVCVCLAEPRRHAIPVVRFKVAFSSVRFGVLTETVKLLFTYFFNWAVRSATGNSN
jgi:hypothetical protein